MLNSDGLFVRDVVIDNCAGHGVVATRWHAGCFEGFAYVCGGSGLKLQQANGLRLDVRAEQNAGYGLHVRDTGIDRYQGGDRLGNDGTINYWKIWCEANNGRGIPGGHGYRYSQMKLENTARLHLVGHTGWRSNQVRVDAVSRELNDWSEECTPPRRAPDRELAAGSITFPQDAPRDREVSNFDVVWPDSRFRPTIESTDNGIRVTYPVGALDNVAKREVAYWRPFGRHRMLGPGTFVFQARVQDATGAISDYCRRREEDTPRQTPIVAVFDICPVAGALTGFPLWDVEPRTLSGQITVRDTRNDLGASLNCWAPGMENTGHAAQTAEHVLLIHQLNLWKLV